MLFMRVVSCLELPIFSILPVLSSLTPPPLSRDLASYKSVKIGNTRSGNDDVLIHVTPYAVVFVQEEAVGEATFTGLGPPRVPC